MISPNRFSPAASVANQVRSKVLGVNTGGHRGRPAMAHKGVGINKNKGGLNTRGSGTAPRPVKVVAQKVAAKTAPDPYRSIMRGGKRVLVRLSQLTPAEKAGIAKPVAGPATKPVTSTAPVTTLPADPAAPTGPLDYRALPGYMASTADLDYELGGRRRDVQTQLAENARLYGTAHKDAKASYARDVESGEDNLNRGGLLRSGVREVADTDRFKEFDTHLAEIETNYGSVASGKLNQALEELAAWEAQQRRAIEAQGRDDYNELYPAMPVADEPAAPTTPVAATPIASKPTKPVARKPANPGAKSFTDAAGNVRQIGTGKIIKAAPKWTPPVRRPAPRPEVR